MDLKTYGVNSIFVKIHFNEPQTSTDELEMADFSAQAHQ
jgi:hypothetical protein